MGINLELMKAKLAELNGSSRRADILWKPQAGDNLIRIVPLASNPESPFIEMYFHYLGGQTRLSPLTYGEPDPIAEFGQALRSENAGKMTKEEWAQTKKFSPQLRTYVPVIDRNRPELGVRFWAFGKTTLTELLGIMADPEYGDITDVNNGRDLKVIYTPREKSETGFAKTAIRPSVKQTKLSDNPANVKSWTTDQPDLNSVFKRYSYEELREYVTRYVTGEAMSESSTSVVEEPTSSDDEWNTGREPSPSAAKSASTVKKSKAVEDAEDEFAKVFGN